MDGLTSQIFSITSTFVMKLLGLNVLLPQVRARAAAEPGDP
jgi:hypothetical protein